MSFKKNGLFKRSLVEFEIQWEKGTIKSFKSLENPNLNRQRAAKRSVREKEKKNHLEKNPNKTKNQTKTKTKPKFTPQ